MSVIDLDMQFAAGSRLEKGQYLSFARSLVGDVQRLPDVRAVNEG
jgi:hypothetical protein